VKKIDSVYVYNSYDSPTSTTLHVAGQDRVTRIDVDIIHRTVEIQLDDGSATIYAGFPFVVEGK